MEEEIVSLDKDGKLKVLGLLTLSKKIRIEVNGIDITKNVMIETFRIVKEE